jgi:hypothetical protein
MTLGAFCQARKPYERRKFLFWLSFQSNLLDHNDTRSQKTAGEVFLSGGKG